MEVPVRIGSIVPEKLALEIVNGTYFTALFLLMACIHFVERCYVLHKKRPLIGILTELARQVAITSSM